MALYNKITGQAFMEAFEGLKGGGQITQIEGDKATQALLEMNTAQSEPAFRIAAMNFKKHLKNGLEKAKKKKSIMTGQAKTPKTIKITGRQDVINAYKSRFGKDPTESQIQQSGS